MSVNKELLKYFNKLSFGNPPTEDPDIWEDVGWGINKYRLFIHPQIDKFIKII